MIRVFPRKINATPEDDRVYISGPPLWKLEEENVYVSCTFTWDKQKAERLAELWGAAGYDVKIGGPAYDDPGGEFVPGRFLKKGYIFTSRGCNNHCWFCSAWRREGPIRELPIREGWRVLDSNLLQCSETHIRAVFAMLGRQPLPISFLGGLEAKRLEDWQVDAISKLKTAQIYFAYDTPDDYEPLVLAARKMWAAGFTPASHKVCCYVLIGYEGDTYSAAGSRLHQVMALGLTPFAMLYRNEKGELHSDWRTFQRRWVRPEIIYAEAMNHAKK